MTTTTKGTTTPIAQRLLSCLVYPGMFSDEMAVAYKPKRAKQTVASYFVPKDKVVDGRLRVAVFREGDATWAIVPNETQTVIEVDEDDLRAP